MTGWNVEVRGDDAWAQDVAEALAHRFAERTNLVLSLPTGSTPLPVYERLPGVLATRRISLGAATIVQLDEYLGLPAGHPARCDEQIRGQLIERLAGPRPAFLTFDVDGADQDAACAALDDAVARLGGLDLVVLGLGRNGHVGMNEPGSAADSRSRVMDLAPSTIATARGYGADPPPARGVTLGLAEIRAAREIWLLATGPRKAAILAAVLEGPRTSDIPATLLRDHPNIRVIADASAAGS